METVVAPRAQVQDSGKDYNEELYYKRIANRCRFSLEKSNKRVMLFISKEIIELKYLGSWIFEDMYYETCKIQRPGLLFLQLCFIVCRIWF